MARPFLSRGLSLRHQILESQGVRESGRAGQGWAGSKQVGGSPALSKAKSIITPGTPHSPCTKPAGQN